MLIVIGKYEKVRKSTWIVLEHYSVHGMPLPNKAHGFKTWRTPVLWQVGRLLLKPYWSGFGPCSYDDPMEVLTRLRQQSSVEEYKCKFEALSNRLRGLSEAYKLSCFLSVLKEEIKLPVRMFNSISLLVAYGLGKIQEEHVLNGRTN
jgi:hypothetical protein